MDLEGETAMERDLAVRELQQALRAVLAAEGYPGVIYPDGFFGPETDQAVRLYQRLNSLPETGEVDQALWEMLAAAYWKVLQEKKMLPLPLFPNADFVMQRGSTGDLVSSVQRLLMELSALYANIPRLAVTGVYDTPTEQAVRQMQKKGGLPENGALDRASWNLLVTLLDRPL